MKLDGLTQAEYLAIARDIYSKRASGDHEPILELFHENATYRLIGSRALIPAAGLRVGKREIREAWRAFDVDFETVDFDIDDCVVETSRISYISWRTLLRHRGASVIADLEGIDRIRWVDYRIIEFTRYFDTALMAALADRETH
jgi:ketosteroid isomerase-like protein